MFIGFNPLYAGHKHFDDDGGIVISSVSIPYMRVINDWADRYLYIGDTGFNPLYAGHKLAVIIVDYCIGYCEVSIPYMRVINKEGGIKEIAT